MKKHQKNMKAIISMPKAMQALLITLLTVAHKSVETIYDVIPTISSTAYTREYNNPTSPFLYFTLAGVAYRVDQTTIPPPAPVMIGTGTTGGEFVFPFKGTSTTFGVMLRHDSNDSLLKSTSLNMANSPPLSLVNYKVITGIHFIKLSFSPTGKIFLIPFNENGQNRRRRRLLLNGSTTDLCYLSSINPTTGTVATPVVLSGS